MAVLFTPVARHRLLRACALNVRGSFFVVCEEGFLDDEGVSVSDEDMLVGIKFFLGPQADLRDVLLTPYPNEGSLVNVHDVAEEAPAA